MSEKIEIPAKLTIGNKIEVILTIIILITALIIMIKYQHIEKKEACYGNPITQGKECLMNENTTTCTVCTLYTKTEADKWQLKNLQLENKTI